jgi:hypothetical protein
MLQRLRTAFTEEAEAVVDAVVDDLKDVNERVTGTKHGRRRAELRKVVTVQKIKKDSMLSHFLSNKQRYQNKRRKITKWLYLERRKRREESRTLAWKAQPVEVWMDHFEAAMLHGVSADADASDALNDRQRVREIIDQNPRRFQYWIQQFKDALAAAGIYTAGEVVDKGFGEKQIQMMCDGAHVSVARAILNDEGEWVDVTHIVNEQRYIKAYPQSFDNSYSAEMIIDILYRQAYVWIGAPFCPWLPLVACLTQFIMFQALKYSMTQGGYRAPKEPWGAGQVEDLFLRYALSTLLFCVVPITMWMNQEPLCGPHQGFNIFATLGVFLSEEVSGAGALGSIAFVATYLCNPPFLIIVIFVMWTRYRFTDSELDRVQNEYKHLQRAYTRDKAFLTQECRNITAAFGPEEVQRVAAAEVAHAQDDMQHSLGGELVSQMGEAYAKDFARLKMDADDIVTIQGFVDLALKFDRNANGHIEPGTEEKRWRRYCSSASVWVGSIPAYWASKTHIQETMQRKFGAVVCCTLQKQVASKQAEAVPQDRGSWALVTFHSDLVAKRAQKGTLSIRGAGKFASTVSLQIVAVDEVLGAQTVDIAECLEAHYNELREAVEAASVRYTELPASSQNFAR